VSEKRWGEIKRSKPVRNRLRERGPHLPGGSSLLLCQIWTSLLLRLRQLPPLRAASPLREASPSRAARYDSLLLPSVSLLFASPVLVC